VIILEIKVNKTKEGITLSGNMPSDLANSETLEIFPLRDGAYLLTVKGFVNQTAGRSPAESALNEEEKNLIRKLSAVRFEKRIPAEVDRILTKNEKGVLDGLIKKKYVVVFHGKKYEKDGVYNISDFAYANARGMPVMPYEEEAPPVARKETSAPAPSTAKTPFPTQLEKNGWMILDNEGDAKQFSANYYDRIKNGDANGLRGFDKKYYFVKADFAQKCEKKILSAIEKEDKTAEEIAEEIKIAPEGCMAVLIHLAEAGEVLEKQKGKFARA